jgi:histidinol-phosphatase
MTVNKSGRMSASLSQYLDFAVETAYLAGRLTLGHFQTGVQAELKTDGSPVTNADRGAEELIRHRIESRYPGHAVVGEEYGATGGMGGSHCWYIDPIDGTQAFLHGVPLYAVLLGLEIEGSVDVGVAYFPALDEMLMASTGEGCYCNGRRAVVSDVTSLAEATVVFSDIATFAKRNRAKAWERIQKATFYRGGWGDAYGYLLIATGRAELMLDASMSPWDCGPFPPILNEAGGYFGDWRGNRTIHANEAMATTHTLLPEVLALIQAE